jgi:hypothetical protein
MPPRGLLGESKVGEQHIVAQREHDVGGLEVVVDYLVLERREVGQALHTCTPVNMICRVYFLLEVVKFSFAVLNIFVERCNRGMEGEGRGIALVYCASESRETS